MFQYIIFPATEIAFVFNNLSAINEAIVGFNVYIIIQNAGQSHQKLCNFNNLKAQRLDIESLVLHCPLYVGKSIDGKTQRGSHHHRLGKRAIHMVSAFASEQGLTLGQIKTAHKSNEITAIPQLLAMLELRGSIVTIDSMGC